MASLAAIAANYTFLLFSWHSAANSNFATIVGAVLWIALMTWICYRGIELSARIQTVLLGIEIVHAHAVRGRRADQGLRQPSSRLDPRHRLVVQPLRCQLERAGRRTAARHLHLLGLGLGRRGQRGVPRPPSRAGQGRGRLDADPAADLRRRRRRRAGLPRHAVPRRQFGRRPERARDGRVRIAARQAADHHRADFGLGVDADDDPADGPDNALDGEVELDPANRSARSIRASSLRPSRRC